MHFSKAGIRFDVCHSAEEACERVLAPGVEYLAVLTDVNMSGMDGIEFCTWMSKHRPDVAVVVMTAFTSMESAVSAMRAGAVDYIQKPLHMEGTVNRMRRVIDARQLQTRVERLERALHETRAHDDLLGASAAMKQIYSLIKRVSDTPTSVLVTGETGTGKELVARALHNGSRRREGPFVAVNCSAIPEHLFESELFGHTRGAFTDARSDRVGLLAQADGGTLFLDELGDLPITVQPKLLRSLEERVIRPVGANQEQSINIRVVAATHADLDTLVSEGRFREDLYFRINVIRMHLPPLRSRGHDILLLAQHFIERYARLMEKPVTGFKTAAAEQLLVYHWPGNIRELRNCVEHAVTLTEYERVGLEDLPPRIRDYSPSHVIVAGSDPAELLPMHEVERLYVQRVMQTVDGNKTLAAKILGFDRKTLYRKIERYEKQARAGG